MTWRSRSLAKEKGAFAGDPSAEILWRLSKRELMEVALRLTMKETPVEAVAAVHCELGLLRGQGIV